jgi:hypothetical protein
LQGSDTGIRKMVYGSRSDVIVGAGFQFSGLVWDASSNRLLMKLVGHRSTIIDVAILKTMCVLVVHVVAGHPLARARGFPPPPTPPVQPLCVCVQLAPGQP